MRFTPKTEKEVSESNLWPNGRYSYEVLDAEDQTSTKGNEMIKLKIQLFDDEGKSRVLSDYLLETLPHKLRHFAVTNGMEEKYNTGTLTAADCIGKQGFCKLGIKKDKTGQYPDQNTITDYLPRPEKLVSQSAQAPLDDDVPF